MSKSNIPQMLLDDGDLVSEVSVDAVVSMLSPLPTSSLLLHRGTHIS